MSGLAAQVLILPGLGGPRPGHWTMHWLQDRDHTLVAQHDWQRPLRGDWLMGLEEAVLVQSGPLLLAADGLACWLVAAWAAHSCQTHKVIGTLLVEPPELKSERLLTLLPSWSLTPAQRLPFSSVVVAGDSAAPIWAQAWGSSCLPIVGARSEPAWPQGRALLKEFTKD